ncbi:MAG: DUF4350 domain-containing protein [Deltaproteobacteria bacterium]|nr:DUF4350 domain-containing protein [Deltaproteobacteria bacterium]
MRSKQKCISLNPVPHLREIVATLVLLAPVTCLSQEAHARQGDYSLEHSDWNGLSDFAALAAGLGHVIEARSTLDWNELSLHDALLIVYPRAPIEPLAVAAFLRRGGTLLIADDFGHTQGILARLGLLRQPPQGRRDARWHEGNPALPVARVLAPGHPLAQGVKELYTNHPATFRITRDATPVLGLSGDQIIVAAGAMGEGRVVALSDPSVLINGMLAFPENLVFAGNLLRFLIPEGEAPVEEEDAPGRATSRGRRVFLVTGEFTLSGAPPATLDDPRRPRDLNELLAAFGKYLDELNDYTTSSGVLWALSVAFALVTCWLCARRVLPAWRRPVLDGSWTRARPDRALTAIEAAALGDRMHWFRPWRGLALAAAILRDRVDTRLAEVLGQKDPLATPSRDLLPRIRKAVGDDAARELAPLLPCLARMPGESQLRAQPSPAMTGSGVSPRELKRLYKAWQALEPGAVRDA